MKKIFRALACIFAALSLCSCLRDAYPLSETVASSSSVPLESSAEQDTVSFESESESETDSPIDDELPLREEVVRWCEANPASDDVIMTLSEIQTENERMRNTAPSMYDIFSFGNKISSEHLYSMISEHNVPHGGYDSDGSVIHDEHMDTVRRRMSLDGASEYNISYGVMTTRGYVRAIPDDKPYRTSPANPYDTVQSTELSLGSPVLVLYSTFDEEYYFILSYCYSGWVKCSELALANDREHWLEFAKPQSFICITDSMYIDGEIKLDMGAVLPLAEVSNDGYKATLPCRRTDGMLDSTTIYVSKTSASNGYLPYTYKNYLIQAYKYEGTPYGWGGLDDGIDCSGFVCNVFRCFGFIFPRDTSQQNSIVGVSCKVGETSAYSLLDTFVPTVVYYPGHTLLYIGRDSEDGKYYFIHAPQIGEKVCVTAKNELNGMTYVCHISTHTTD